MNRSASALDAPSFSSYVDQRDYVGALALLDTDEELSPVDKLLWIGYCASKLGDHHRAEEAYLELLFGKFKDEDVPLATSLYLAIVYIRLGQYTDAEETALSFVQDLTLPDSFESGLRARILLHIAQRTRDETKVAEYRQQLSDSTEDMLSIAALEYSFRHRYQDAVDAYKNVLVADTNAVSLYVYTALALFKMGCYDQSLEALSIYCQAHPDSPIAANLKACSMFHLCNGKAALEVLDAHCDGKTLENHDLVRHNAVVFNDGKKALQVWTKLLDRVPEAKHNLAIHYLKQGEIAAAAQLFEDIDACSPQDHLVLGIVNAELARENGDMNALAKAKHHFQCMGQSSTECDTVSGRQCMASCLYLENSFEDAIPYLESIEQFSEDDDAFLWNYGMSLAASGKFDEGLRALLKVSIEAYKTEVEYALWVTKCHIMTNHPEEAWEYFLQIEDSHASYEALQLIANECYKSGGESFFYSAKSFGELLKLDSYPDYVDGLLGASVGYFRHVLSVKHKSSNKLSMACSESLMEIAEILEASSVPRSLDTAHVIKKWLAQA